MKKIAAALLATSMLASPAFADSTINALSAGTTLGGTEQIPMFQTANPAVTTTPAALNTYVGGVTHTWSAAQTFTEVVGAVTTQSGTTYTFAATDCGTEVTFSNAGAVTATIPNTLPAGCNIAVAQIGAGKVSVNGSAVTPATLHTHVASSAATGTGGQYASGRCR